MNTNILRKDLILESCGEISKHQKGCYIRFKDGIIIHSKERQDCVIDYDENDEVIGIEFYDGL